MSVDIRLPNITGKTEAEQLSQVKSYLYQVVEQLNFALKNVESSAVYAVQQSVGSSSKGSTEDEAVDTFNSIKALIIKSADIVESYYESINARLESIYVAKSEFGTYTEEATADIEANSTSIEELYSNVQQIVSDVEGISNSIIEVNAHIKSGLLYYGDDGAPVYGLEIGQQTEIDGEEVFNKYAQFTAEKLSFFDSNGVEVAYISDQKLYITNVEVKGSFIIGGFVDTVMASGDVVEKWVQTGG